jgi:hypothetical protein
VGAYPDRAHASFLIDYPDSWKVTPATEDGGYVILEGPTGALLYFRTIPGTEDDLLAAVKATTDDITQNYSNVNMSKAKDAKQNGLDGFVATATGTSEAGDDVAMVAAWLFLPDGTIGELWYSCIAGDQEGTAEASKILDSFRAP